MEFQRQSGLQTGWSLTIENKVATYGKIRDYFSSFACWSKCRSTVMTNSDKRKRKGLDSSACFCVID